jgi:hypothetical protein
MDILKPARDEIRSLEKTVADAMARLEDLRAFVQAGERLYGNLEEAMPSLRRPAEWPLPQARHLTPRQKEVLDGVATAVAESKASRIVARAEWALSDGRHMQSKDLAGILIDHGIDLGKDPISTLSAYLSKSGRFVSERAKGGWALKPQAHKEAPPPDVAASAGA